MCSDPDILLVCLLDDGAVELRRQLGHRVVAVIDPDLDDVRPPLCVLLHRLARFGDGADPVGALLAPLLYAGDTTAGCQEPGSSGHVPGFIPDLEHDVGRVRAHTHPGANTPIGAASQVTNHLFARRRRVDMSVENHRHDGLASEVHPLGPRGHLHLGTNSLDRRAVDDDGSVLDRRAAVADDDPRPFERGDRRLGSGWNRQSGKHSGNACYCYSEYSRSAHRSLHQ